MPIVVIREFVAISNGTLRGSVPIFLSWTFLKASLWKVVRPLSWSIWKW